MFTNNLDLLILHESAEQIKSNIRTKQEYNNLNSKSLSFEGRCYRFLLLPLSFLATSFVQSFVVEFRHSKNYFILPV